MSDGNKPVAEVKIWPLQCAIWEQERTGNNGNTWTAYSTKFERVYKNKDGAYETTNYLNENDLLVAGEVLRQAFHKIQALKNAAHKSGGGGAKPAQAAPAKSAKEDLDDEIPF